MSHCYLTNTLGTDMPRLKWNNYQICLAFLSQMLHQVFLFRCHLSLSSRCVFHGYSVYNSLRTYACRNQIVLHPLKLALVGFQFVQSPLSVLCNTDWNQSFFDVFFLDVRESHILIQKKKTIYLLFICSFSHFQRQFLMTCLWQVIVKEESFPLVYSGFSCR